MEVEINGHNPLMRKTHEQPVTAVHKPVILGNELNVSPGIPVRRVILTIDTPLPLCEVWSPPLPVSLSALIFCKLFTLRKATFLNS